MSNIILGYYSCVYFSILMKRFFKMNYIKKLGLYYKMPNSFFTNLTISNYELVDEIGIISQFLLLKNRTNVYLSTCHDILETIIPLCRKKIAKCIYINLKNKNYIHEIYKLRQKLITKLLIPKKLLLNEYTVYKEKNVGYLIGIHIRTSIYSDFKERSFRFYNNETERLYHKAIKYIIKKYENKNIKFYIISDSTKIKLKFIKQYNKFIQNNIITKKTKISHTINDVSIIEQYILSKCNVIIGSCESTFTLLSVFRYLHDYYAIEGVEYSSRGKIRGKCGYELDYNHHLFSSKN